MSPVLRREVNRMLLSKKEKMLEISIHVKRDSKALGNKWQAVRIIPELIL